MKLVDLLPLVAFALAILWMIRQGDKAKRDYLRRKRAGKKEKQNAL